MSEQKLETVYRQLFKAKASIGDVSFRYFELIHDETMEGIRDPLDGRLYRGFSPMHLEALSEAIRALQAARSIMVGLSEEINEDTEASNDAE